MLNAVATLRLAVPAYGNGKGLTRAEISHAADVFQLSVHRSPDLVVPAVLTPPLGGRYRLILRSGLGPKVENYIRLHELAHIVAGDAEEATILRFDGPLPEAEVVADLVALMGLLDDADCAAGAEWVESRIRRLVPLDDRGWQLYRCADLAPKAVRMRALLREWS